MEIYLKICKNSIKIKQISGRNRLGLDVQLHKQKAE